MPLPRIIGISGHIGVGKDTFADIICKTHPQYSIVGFADAVKKITSIITSLPLDFVRTREGKNFIPEGRPYSVGRYMQLIGQGFRDILSPDIWIKVLLDKHRDDYIIIPDVRYPNEADAIRERGGIVIRLERNITFSDGRDINHPSEIALDNYEFFSLIIDNNGPLEDLISKVGEISRLG